jgi:hypothetical protein
MKILKKSKKSTLKKKRKNGRLYRRTGTPQGPDGDQSLCQLL